MMIEIWLLWEAHCNGLGKQETHDNRSYQPGALMPSYAIVLNDEGTRGTWDPVHRRCVANGPGRLSSVTVVIITSII
jgi:hypothetical protein